MKAEQLFSALSDTLRCRIYGLLSFAGREICVCEIAEYFHEASYTVSRALSALKKSGLIQSRKDGRWVHYSLSEIPEHKHLKPLLESTLEPQEISRWISENLQSCSLA